MERLLEGWHLKPAVEALMAFRGFKLVAAMVTASGLGDILRFDHPRLLMSYLGLVSSEHSSGMKRRQGAISLCGNSHLRWMLVECAQHYAKAPKVSKELSRRQEGQPQQILAISWKAQKRLHTRFMKLTARRMPRNKAVVAVARELCGFIWAALRSLECYRSTESADCRKTTAAA